MGCCPLLGVRPLLGELIRKEDDVPGAPDRVVLTHGYWQRAFGAARDVVGQSLVIDAQAVRDHRRPAGLVQVPGYGSASDPAIATQPRERPHGSGFGPRGVARLKPGVTLSQANDDIARMIPLIVEQFPLQPGVTREMWQEVGLAPNVRPLSEDVIGEMSRPLWILLGTVGVVLLMAWTNVANLLLVRAEGRQRELAVRTALGASRGRIASELLSESLVLGLAGGALGVLFAQAGIGLLRRMAPAALPRVDEIGIDAVVLLFTLTHLGRDQPAVRPHSRPEISSTLNFAVLKDAGRSASDAPGGTARETRWSWHRSRSPWCC